MWLWIFCPQMTLHDVPKMFPIGVNMNLDDYWYIYAVFEIWTIPLQKLVLTCTKSIKSTKSKTNLDLDYIERNRTTERNFGSLKQILERPIKIRHSWFTNLFEATKIPFGGPPFGDTQNTREMGCSVTLYKLIFMKFSISIFFAILKISYLRITVKRTNNFW